MMMVMKNTAIIQEEWARVLQFFPGDFESGCYEKLAIIRRREVSAPQDLLRLCLAYGMCDMPFRQIAAWATAVGIAEISDVAVMKRLRGAEAWLGHLVAQWLNSRKMVSAPGGGTIRIIDATSLSCPASKGTDFRIHVSLSAGTLRIADMEVSDASAGESLKRHKVDPGDIVIGDRAYCSVEGIRSILVQEGHVIVRGTCSAPFRGEGGRRIDVVELLRTLADDEIGDWPVYLRGKDGSMLEARLIGIRQSGPAAQRERKHIARTASRKGRITEERTVETAGYIFVITDLPARSLSAVEALELYRWRWQIELLFKRLKSLLNLDSLRAKGKELSRVYILSKLLGALLVEELSVQAVSFFPWGFPLSREAAQPVEDVCAGGGPVALGHKGELSHCGY
jgi:hypothetical protein